MKSIFVCLFLLVLVDCKKQGGTDQKIDRSLTSPSAVSFGLIGESDLEVLYESLSRNPDVTKRTAYGGIPYVEFEGYAIRKYPPINKPIYGLSTGRGTDIQFYFLGRKPDSTYYTYALGSGAATDRSKDFSTIESKFEEQVLIPRRPAYREGTLGEDNRWIPKEISVIFNEDPVLLQTRIDAKTLEGPTGEFDLAFFKEDIDVLQRVTNLESIKASHPDLFWKIKRFQILVRKNPLNLFVRLSGHGSKGQAKGLWGPNSTGGYHRGFDTYPRLISLLYGATPVPQLRVEFESCNSATCSWEPGRKSQDSMVESASRAFSSVFGSRVSSISGATGLTNMTHYEDRKRVLNQVTLEGSSWSIRYVDMYDIIGGFIDVRVNNGVLYYSTTIDRFHVTSDPAIIDLVQARANITYDLTLSYDAKLPNSGFPTFEEHEFSKSGFQSLPPERKAKALQFLKVIEINKVLESYKSQLLSKPNLDPAERERIQHFLSALWTATDFDGVEKAKSEYRDFEQIKQKQIADRHLRATQALTEAETAERALQEAENLRALREIRERFEEQVRSEAERRAEAERAPARPDPVGKKTTSSEEARIKARAAGQQRQSQNRLSFVGGVLVLATTAVLIGTVGYLITKDNYNLSEEVPPNQKQSTSKTKGFLRTRNEVRRYLELRE
ncbi:MAG: hypothetical protein KA436_11380 [Oligoflexales bacterium]|nr:hypothetical protein [Oligoflexales bacterium]